MLLQTEEAIESTEFGEDCLRLFTLFADLTGLLPQGLDKVVLSTTKLITS